MLLLSISRCPRAPLGLLALTAVLLSACGGGGSDDASTPDPRPAPLPAPPASGAAPSPAPSPAPAPAPAPAPTPAPTPAPPPVTTTLACSASGSAAFREELLARVNAQRAAARSCGARGSFSAVPALSWSSTLEAAALGHSQDMATRDYFSHTSLDGRSFTQRIEAAGYRWRSAAENIAAGQSSVQAVVDGWMASDGHCANIMGAGLREVAVACVPSSTARYRSYWTMNLATPR